MKLTIDNFEVEIKAKGVYENKFNEKDTIALLNKISLLASVAAYHYKDANFSALEKEADGISDEIYNFLESIGAYE